jgi:hypothetical protein
MVAGAWFGCAFRRYDRLFLAVAGAHQQPGCPLAAGFFASQLARLASALGQASRYPSRFFGCCANSSCYVGCQTMRGNMRILITEPNGLIGRMVLSELLAPEFSVRVITRDPSFLPEELRRQVEVVRGASEDSAMLRQALDDVEALFWCVPAAPLNEVNVRAYHERLALACCHAIREAGTRRVAAISAVASVAGHNPVPTSCLNEMEDILNQSGAAIRHLRCGWFMEISSGKRNGFADMVFSPIRSRATPPSP